MSAFFWVTMDGDAVQDADGKSLRTFADAVGLSHDLMIVHPEAEVKVWEGELL